jgi:signal transduction histidine kinase
MLAGQGLKLSAAKQIMLKQPETAQTLLSDVIQKNEETVSEIRRLVYGLRPPTLDELGLVASLEAEGQAILGQIALKIETSPDPLPPLSAAVEVAVYRIVMEALNNVARHAQAKSCWVQLKVANQFTLNIQDDGQGLPPQVKPGVGLQSMAERTAELDGTFSITNLPDGGTQILAMLPLAETTPERRIPQ